MSLADVSVKRQVFAIMMTAALIVLGAFSYKDLGLDLMPKTDSPNVNVQVQLPGASAEEVETQITKRIEEAVNTISGIDELRANSNQGQGQANITFALERDIESATQDVRDKVATIVNQFPRDAKQPRPCVIALLACASSTVAAAQAKLAAIGFEAVASSPEEFADRIRNEIPKWRKVIKDAGIEVSQ